MTSPAPPLAQRPLTPVRTSADGARFLPGQMLADRYRMIGLLGKGGMGEVYRADDLKLGQPVALKFLPRDVEGDPERLERFLTEVRLSLRVTHPNVCRVFDIGQFGDRHFLSMEYVDGEDLASLLRRIGRLPEDKAVEIARQLCAGLAAAHDEGVLHRDLKPANVMIDGRGRAKITDFGLAGATAGISGREAQAGTPHYMAPEQFDGRELTVQTDIYALGLVLYELFTGKRAFEGRNVADLAAVRSSTPTSPAAHVSGLNPIIERAIMRCLDPDPAARPRSAATLAASLPGGDPLAMAIAAGETPSPEMVARAGGRGELRPGIAIACLGVVLAGLAFVMLLEQRFGLHNRVPLPKPPEELRIGARAILAAAGRTEGPHDDAYGFVRDNDYFAFVERSDPSPARWDTLGTVAPVPIFFWYRESPRRLVPLSNYGRVNLNNPPVALAGMARVRLDPSGHLQDLTIIPPDVTTTPGPYPEPDWTPLFSAAGFVREEWAEAAPIWTPPDASDVRRAWTKDTLRVEAAAFLGKPVWFRVVPPWRRPAATGPTDSAVNIASGMVAAIIVVAGAVLARRNIRQGRSDRRGAFRLAAVFFAASAGTNVLRSGDPIAFFDLFGPNFGGVVYGAATIWLCYVAIEPYVRRWWPRTLVSWGRVVDGQWRDPMVGRDVLLGAAGGIGLTLLFYVPTAADRFHAVPVAPLMYADPLVSGPLRIAVLLDLLHQALIIPVAALVAVLLCRLLFRRAWLAYAVVCILAVVFILPAMESPLMVLVGLAATIVTLVILTRLGLLALMVAIPFSSWPEIGLTADPSSWFFAGSAATIAAFAAIAIYGFAVSLGGHKLIKDAI
jgi:hypothetical protein